MKEILFALADRGLTLDTTLRAGISRVGQRPRRRHTADPDRCSGPTNAMADYALMHAARLNCPFSSLHECRIMFGHPLAIVVRDAFPLAAGHTPNRRRGGHALLREISPLEGEHTRRQERIHMFALMYLLAAAVYLTLMSFVVRWAWRNGRRDGGSLAKAGTLAFLGFLAVHVPIFWNHIPTVLMHGSLCAKQAAAGPRH